MNRRGFLNSILGLVGSLFGWKLGRKAIAKPEPEYVMQVRHVAHFSLETGLIVNRIDVLYGFGTLKPEMTCRIES